TGRQILGSADVSGTAESYEADVADNGEPGHGVDQFQLWLNGALVAPAALLSGGNIQLHKACEERRHRPDIACLGAPSIGAPSLLLWSVGFDPSAFQGVILTCDLLMFSDLRSLRRDVHDCRRWPLGFSRTHAVPGVGPENARIMIVGEAPGQNEDLQGEPFVGAAGKLLDQLLRGIGLSRGDVFITNILKCRPPGNRDPQPAEAEACSPYLEQQLR